jgi:lipopolysaccharide/colanic/teichoic acid biosynthesis glycosyltransferase
VFYTPWAMLFMSSLEFFSRAAGSAATERRGVAAGRLAAKRALDIGLALVGLICLSVPLLLIACLVRLTSEGPAIFMQTRVGRGGRPFTIYKFRTFDTERGDPAAAWRAPGSDAEVTPLGRFLRRASLDELPQLFNVLRGDMSLVGPRPLVPGMVVEGVLYDDIVPGYARRHAVRPGLTGLAQVSGFRGPIRGRATAETRLRLDLAYVDGFTLAGDVKILALTLWRELRRPSGS